MRIDAGVFAGLLSSEVPQHLGEDFFEGVSGGAGLGGLTCFFSQGGVFAESPNGGGELFGVAEGDEKAGAGSGEQILVAFDGGEHAG